MVTDRDKFITWNLALVTSRVLRINRGHYDEDMFQAGCVGLIKAVDKFDPSRGYAFSTYAVPTIDGHIQVYKQRTNHLIRPLRQNRSGDELYSYRHVESMDAPIKYNDENLYLSNILEDSANVEADATGGLIVEFLLSKLNEQERRIIELRMEEYSQQDIADMIGTTQANVSRKIRKCKTILAKYGYEREAADTYKRNHFRTTACMKG